MTAAETSVRPPLVLAPRVRFLRILYRILPWFGLGILIVVAAWVLGVPADGMEQLVFVALSLLVYGLGLALVTEVFSPDRAALRLIPISDTRARRLAATIRALLFFMLLTGAGILLIERNGWRVAMADVLRVVRDVVLVLAGAAILSSTGIVRGLKDAEESSWWATAARFLGRVVFPVLVVTLLFLVITAGIGYRPLAQWFLGNAVWTVVKLLVAVLAYRWLRRALYRIVHFYRGEDQEADADEDAPALADSDVTGLGIALVGGGLLKFLAIVFTFFWILASWDLGPSAFIEMLRAPIVSGGEKTWLQVIESILSVVAVVAAGWFLKNLLTFFIFPKSSLGVGARYAILAVLRYVMIALAIVFALGALGVNTSSLGWFFGAAGIGIGLGLQDIIGNFISGLIMLVERPIRVGDTVSVGTTMGKVENIRMRGTVLRTFDNTTVLIPNNQMLGERVTNLSHSMHHVRLIVEIGVSYDADPAEVRELLLEVVRAHPNVLPDPEPKVQFHLFGASSIDFRVICYTHELGGRLGIASDLRFEIFKRLGEAGIEIPFPQQDLHIRSGPGADMPLLPANPEK